MSFVNDLAFWKENEHTVLEIVQRLFPEWKWKLNIEKKWVDILSWDWKLSIECKVDRKAMTTWNVFIEIECNWKPSWIYKYDWVNVLTYSFGNIVYIINIKLLKQLIETRNSEFKKIKCWDGWRSVGYLIPISEIRKITHKIINYVKN